MTEPKLLTEAEWRDLWYDNQRAAGCFIDALRERGLIAEEPVDPLLVEAREMLAKHYEAIGDCKQLVSDIRGGKFDSDAEKMDEEIGLALAALRRGMELQREKLTREMVREMVREALETATLDHLLRPNEGDHPDAFSMRRDRLHAALTEALQ